MPQKFSLRLVSRIAFKFKIQIGIENSKVHEDDQSMNKQEEITLSTTHNSIVDPPHKIHSLLFTRSWYSLKVYARERIRNQNNLHISTMKSTF